MKRFTNADIIKGNITNSEVLNQYAYANGNPISNIDPFGLFSWKKFLDTAVTLVAGAAQIVTGIAMCATGSGAVVGAALILNGVGDFGSGIIKGINMATDKTIDDDNLVKQGMRKVGNKIGGQTGEDFAGIVYDAGSVALSLYGLYGVPKMTKTPTLSAIKKANPGGLTSLMGDVRASHKLIEQCAYVPTKLVRAAAYGGIISDIKNTYGRIIDSNVIEAGGSNYEKEKNRK